jgi:hypothetical protein
MFTQAISYIEPKLRIFHQEGTKNLKGLVLRYIFKLGLVAHSMRTSSQRVVKMRKKPIFLQYMEWSIFLTVQSSINCQIIVVNILYKALDNEIRTNRLRKAKLYLMSPFL